MLSKYFARPFRTPEAWTKRCSARRCRWWGASSSGPPSNARSTKRSAIAWLAQTTVDLQSHVRDFFMDAQETTGECSQGPDPRASRRNSAIISSSACACVGSSNRPSQNLSLSLLRSRPWLIGKKKRLPVPPEVSHERAEPSTWVYRAVLARRTGKRLVAQVGSALVDKERGGRLSVAARGRK